ncbi:GNAT family N-acetyltransferase [Pseudoalteromonas sp. T1lg65]|uniref:GNAT family N-acetyltransferase n=1 Tax=Pseudoalteromonas sp. T1lg65 TaxID=2077101 RepID=UPI003F79A0C6
MDITVKFTRPDTQDYVALREKVGWGVTSIKQANTALNNSLFHVVAYLHDKLIGMARIIGDGAMFFYIQDLVVDPDYQQQGIGDMLMRHTESYLATVAKSGATVALLSAKGKEPFYARYGYTERSGTSLGLGMCKFI